MTETILLILTLTSMVISLGCLVIAFQIWKKVEHEATIRRIDNQLKHQHQHHENNDESY